MPSEPAPPLQLERRLPPLGPGDGTPGQAPAGRAPMLRLPLSAQERTSLRGRRRSACGRELLLQLPRGPALEPGERLLSSDGRVQVQVEPAPETVLVVHSADPLKLLQAAYHLGNRHVSLELRPGELRLLADSVLESLLRQRGLLIEHRLMPFLPEPGAYAGGAHGHGTTDHDTAHHGDAHHHP